MKGKNKNLTYTDLFRTSYRQLSVILAGTVVVTAGNVYLRWCIGEALERGELSLWLLGVAGVLLAVAQYPDLCGGDPLLD